MAANEGSTNAPTERRPLPEVPRLTHWERERICIGVEAGLIVADDLGLAVAVMPDVRTAEERAAHGDPWPRLSHHGDFGTLSNEVTVLSRLLLIEGAQSVALGAMGVELEEVPLQTSLLASRAAAELRAIAVRVNAIGRSLGCSRRDAGVRVVAVDVRCGVGLTGMAEGDVRDEEVLRSGVFTLVALAERPSVKAKLTTERMKVDVSVGRARHIPDDVHLVRLTKTPEEDEPPPPIDLRYVIGAERFYAAAGAESLAVLQHLHEPDPERQWALSTPTIASAVARLGDSAWLAVVADPHALNACLHGKPGGTFATPATFVVAPAPVGAKLRLELAAGLLRVVGRELF